MVTLNKEKNIKKNISESLLLWLAFMPIFMLLGSLYFTFFVSSEKDMFLTGILSIGISFIFLLLFVFYFLKVKEENRVLERLLIPIDKNKIDKEVETLASSLKKENKKEIYDYLESLLNRYYKNNLTIEKLNKENKKFLTNLSYEVRTPLNGIVGYIQLLNETALDQDQKECLSNINNSSEVLLSVMNNILSLSKINDDVVTLKKTSFDIFEKMESVIEKFSIKAEQKNITLGLYTDPQLNRYWIGDWEKIIRVLVNLMENSIKFTPVGGTVSLFVREIELDCNVRSIHFSIQDNRTSIDKNMQKMILGSYKAFDTDQRKEDRNYDIGLTTSSKMLEVMGGKLQIESQEDGGATFSFSLSLCPDKNRKVQKTVDLHSLKVGLALPDRSVYRDVDMFLEEYIRACNAKFSIYYYDDLFGAKGYKVILPDVMIFDHRYARRKGYLNIVQSLECNKVLITTNELKRDIDTYIHRFETIILAPATFDKTQEVLEKFHKSESEFWNNQLENKKLKFENTDVLVVEDNSINQKLIKTLLEKFNLNVTLASNGQEALYLREEKKFDLIFMDIEMPVMDGVEATKRILQYEVQNGLVHVPIVALTANALIGDQEKYLQAGIDYYLPKPIRLQKLHAILERYLMHKNQ